MSDGHDHDDFMQHFLKVQPSLRSYTFALVNSMHEAEDILQEVAMVLWRQFPKYDPTYPFLNWSIGITRNHIAQWRRSRARSRLVLVPAVEAKLAETYDELEDELEDRRHALESCLGKLAPWSREVLDLRYERECSLSEIAKLKSTTLNAVNKALGRIRSFLLKCTGAAKKSERGCQPV